MCAPVADATYVTGNLNANKVWLVICGVLPTHVSRCSDFPIVRLPRLNPYPALFDTFAFMISHVTKACGLGSYASPPELGAHVRGE